MRRGLVLASLVWSGCFRAANPPPVIPPLPHEANLCDAAPRPVDPAAREQLLHLERRLVASVLEDGPCIEDARSPEVCAMTADLHRMLRQFPAVEMVFLFPEPLTIPKSPYWARLGTSTAALQVADHPVFFLELSRVQVVGSPTKGALVAHVLSGPTGVTPSNVIWLWGGYGERCFVPRGNGKWAQYMLGYQAISQRDERRAELARR
jgi:hypothetical protein